MGTYIIKRSLVISLLLVTLVAALNIFGIKINENSSVYCYEHTVARESLAFYDNTYYKFSIILVNNGKLTILDQKGYLKPSYNKYFGTWEITDSNLFCNITKSKASKTTTIDGNPKTFTEKRVYRIEKNKLLSYKDNIALKLISGKPIM